MDVRISPLVELQKARAEIAQLRNRTLLLAQSSEADHADD